MVEIIVLFVWHDYVKKCNYLHWVKWVENIWKVFGKIKKKLENRK